MAEQKAEGSRPFWLNLPTLLILLTLAGGSIGLFQKLTSTRPAVSVGIGREFPGEQKVESRLWEDPFKTPERPSQSDNLSATNLPTRDSSFKGRVDKCSNGLILPVMIPGGPYSEDQESRIRSRFAIVSALGQSGYVPEDAEHIGSVSFLWPTTQGIEQFKNAAKANPSLSWQELHKESVNKTSPRLDLRYEWYRPRSFPPWSPPRYSSVLVLWLNERDFESEPLLRLPLLLEIMEAVPEITEAIPGKPDAPCVALIGPWLSSTLRAMLPDWESDQLKKGPSYPWEKIRKILKHIAVYSATATAMDATLVQNCPDKAKPNFRDCVRKVLVNPKIVGFKSFKNFVATDDQLASEMLNELKLRHVDFAHTNNHLVLLSEWDTFYARMLWLTYAAELAMRQHTTTNQAAFIEQYQNNEKPEPPNLHSFVYLRGLDGQTVEHDLQVARGSDNEPAPQANPTPLDALRKWILDISKDDLRKGPPDANKAEGSAQFDSLSRLGKQLATLEEQLSAKSEHIKAIGVIGSDVYDTLLILQALRHRFPNVLFFTTGLDARFWHPRELSWSRNLIVTSSYGLMLHPDVLQRDSDVLQLNMLPLFRDSSQTAQFAATLAALGHPNLGTLQSVPPRRFEIGKGGEVDLSVQPSFIGMTKSGKNIQLHPDPKGIFVTKTYIGMGIVCLTAVLSFLFFCGPMQGLKWKPSQFQADTLYYRKEDVGGIRGALTLVSCLRKLTQEQKDRWAQRLEHKFKRAKIGGFPAHDYTILLDRIEEAKQSLDKEKAKAGALQEIERCKEELLRGWLHFLNRLLYDSSLPKSPQQLCQGRRILDAWVRRLVDEPRKSGTLVEKNVLATAKAAREASLELYDLQRRWGQKFWFFVVAIAGVAVVLGYFIWKDTFYNPSGEPFSLTTGTSVWPGEILRFVAFALAIIFIIQSYHGLRTTIFQLTRHFRLPLVRYTHSHASGIQKLKRFMHRPAIIWHWLYGTRRLHAPSEPRAAVHASQLWKNYQRYDFFGRRVGRILPLFILYCAFCLGIEFLNQSHIVRPFRGEMAFIWDSYLSRGASLSFLFLTLMTIDTALLCQRFIQHLSKAPTVYPLATTDHFSRLRGDVDRRFLDEWIDLQLIAELTHGVGRLLYYPFIIFFLLLLARNEWWDRWPWSWPLITISVLNLTLAAASVFILQTAARKAKNEAEATLAAKVKRLQVTTVESEVMNNANQAKDLLEEIRLLRRGAFVPIWENPLIGRL